MSLDDILTKHDIGAASPARTSTPPKTGFPVWLIPVGIIAGFAGLFLIVLWPQFKPVRIVQTERALPFFSQTDIAAADREDNTGNPPAVQATATPDVSREPARLLFQAAGWLEPNPLPERVSSLVSGTVAKTYVTDGDKVEKGQLLAELIDTDYRFELDDAKAQLATANAEIGLRKTELETAQAQIRMEEANLKAAEARLQNQKDTHDRYSKLGAGVISEQAVIQARQDLRQQEALVNVAEAKLDTGKTGLNEAQARIKSAEASLDKAQVALDHAQLNLERCKIYSPITGRVLKMMATQGSRLNVDADQSDASTLAHLYDPDELSLRMDVPIEQAGNVFVGQPSQIRCAMFPDRIFTGEVVRIAGEADIQRNALQVRVRLDNPDDMLRPSMPCRAEVFSKPSVSRTPGIATSGDRPVSSGGTGGSLIPAASLAGGDSSPKVWVITLDGKAQQRDIQLQPSSNREGYLAVSVGVLPGEPVIINPSSDLRENESVRSETL